METAPARHSMGMQGFSGSEDTDGSELCGNSVSTLRSESEVLMCAFYIDKVACGMI